MSRSRFAWVFAGGLVALAFAVSPGWAGHHEKGEGHHHKKHGKHMFEKRDANGDGNVSKEEWMAASEERFAGIDSDGSGAISQEEWTAAHERMRERWKQKREKQGS